MTELEAAVKEVKKNSPSARFKNEHGEKFVIYSDGVFVLMGGDEVESMVREENKHGGLINLFNEHFSIWSADELYKLGAALQRVAKKNLKNRNKMV